MNRTTTTQRESIKQFLKAGNSITALEALSLFGAYRLAAHIEVLRNRDGMDIRTSMNKDVTGRTYARYALATPEQKRSDTFLKIYAKEYISKFIAPVQSELTPYAHH